MTPIKMNLVSSTPPPRKLTPWADVLPGQWFETHVGTMFPCMKTEDGGYVSPANGFHHPHDSGCYPNVYVVPDGTEIVITAGMRND